MKRIRVFFPGRSLFSNKVFGTLPGILTSLKSSLTSFKFQPLEPFSRNQWFSFGFGNGTNVTRIYSLSLLHFGYAQCLTLPIFKTITSNYFYLNSSNYVTFEAWELPFKLGTAYVGCFRSKANVSVTWRWRLGGGREGGGAPIEKLPRAWQC